MVDAPGEGEQLEVTVHIDRSLGLSIVLRLRRGATVLELKEQLAKDDPTGKSRPSDFSLRSCQGRFLAEAELLAEGTTRELELDLVPGDSAVENPPPAVRTVEVQPRAVPTAPAVPAALSPAASEELVAVAHFKATNALGVKADSEAANAALSALTPALRHKASRPRLLMARGLVFWRWAKLDRALRDLADAQRMGATGAGLALLALELCLSRWPEARNLAEGLQEAEAVGLVDGWVAGMDAMKGAFSPSDATFVHGKVEPMPGYRQSDARVPVGFDVEIGVRLLLRVNVAGPQTRRPLVLYFHGNAETVDSYLEPETFKPLSAAAANALIADFRGYGFSTGGDGPSMAWLHTDAERVLDALPSLFASWQLPWPWPGGLCLFGRSLGSRIACHLAGLRGALFGGGVVLESAMCGSHAPGAKPPPEPPVDNTALGQSSGVNRFTNDETERAIAGLGKYCQGLVARSMGSQREDVSHFVHMAGNEDKIRGFCGRLLILHGEIDTLIPPSHARRLCDAAEAATRRLVTVGRGHNDLSFHPKYREALKTFLAGQ